MRDVEVRYAEHEGKCLAYEVFGEGPTDLLIHQVCYPIDLTWDLPQLSDFMDSLGECARVIAFDSCGEGASDPIDDPGAATLEAWCDDVFAVLDAAGADRVTVFDMTTGVGGIMLAATYPDRVRSLILSHLWTSNPDSRDMSASDLRQASREFCSVESLEVDNPRVAHDPVLRQWWGRARRLSLSPEAAFDYYRWGGRMDVEPLLSSVRVPTLVLHRREHRVFDIEMSRRAAAKIRDARFVGFRALKTDLSWATPVPYSPPSGRSSKMSHPRLSTRFVPWRPCCSLTSCHRLNSSPPSATAHGDGYSTISITPPSASSPSTGAVVVKQTGDGILATFDGPARESGAPPNSSTPPQRRRSRRAPGYTPERSNSDHPTSPASPCTPPIESLTSRARTRFSCPEPWSTSPPDRA